MPKKFYAQEPREIRATVPWTCAETGKRIKKGEFFLYIPKIQKAYHVSSETYYNFRCNKMDDEIL